MYLGIVGRPKTVGGRHFNGRIFLEQVSKTKRTTKKIKHQRFSTDALINHEIKVGGWKSFHIQEMKLRDMCEMVVNQFDLDEHVSDRLEFH